MRTAQERENRSRRAGFLPQGRLSEYRVSMALEPSATDNPQLLIAQPSYMYSACERENRSSENLTRFLPPIQLVRFNAPFNQVQHRPLHNPQLPSLPPTPSSRP